MRMYQKALLGIVCLLGIGLLAGVAVSQDASTTEKPDKITLQIERLTKDLELTETQQNMVRVILEEKQPKIDALEEQIKQLRKEMDNSITSVLTDEQKAKKEKLDAARRARVDRAGFRGAGRGEGPGPQEGAPMRALEQLNLTDEQKAKIDEIVKNRPQNMREEIMKVLTPEQQEKWKELRAQAAERRAGAGPQGEGRARGGHGGGGRAAQE